MTKPTVVNVNANVNADLALAVDGLVVEITRGGQRAAAVTDISIEVAPGESVGLVGESGCGKSLTLRAISGLLPAGARVAAGDVRTGAGGRTGMVFQEPLSALSPTRRVGNLVAEGLRARGASRSAAREQAIELLTEVSIPDPRRTARSWPHQLSGGLRQRAMIAMALGPEPSLLLCDEPTTALDCTVQDQILGLIDRLRTQRNLAVLFVTHDLAVVGDMCQRVYVMYAGRIVESGTIDEVYTRPRHPYTRALLAANISVSSPRGGFTSIAGQPPDPSAFTAGCRFADRCAHAVERCTSSGHLLVDVTPGHASACVRVRELYP